MINPDNVDMRPVWQQKPPNAPGDWFFSDEARAILDAQKNVLTLNALPTPHLFIQEGDPGYEEWFAKREADDQAAEDRQAAQGKAENRAEYLAKRPEMLRRFKHYYREHLQECRTYSKAYSKAYYQANKARILEQRKLYHEKHKNDPAYQQKTRERALKAYRRKAALP